MKEFDELLRAVREDEWRFDEYTAIHIPSKREVWMANIPVVNTNLYPVEVRLSWREKWELYRALRQKQREAQLSLFKPGHPNG